YPYLDNLDELLEQAVLESAEDSYGRFLNAKMKGVRPPRDDYAGHLKTLKAEFESNLYGLMYGKKVLGRFKAKIQQQTRQNVDVFQVTGSLRSPELQEIMV